MLGRVSALVTIALLVTACGGAAAPGPSASASAGATQAAKAAPMTVAELAAYHGSDREQILVAGAKKEGKLVWYTSLAGDIIAKELKAFQEKYPFVTAVDKYRGHEGELVTKATQEDQAGKPNVDVMETQISAIQILLASKILIPYYTPSAKDVPDAFKTKASGDLIDSATDRFSQISFGYNTGLLPASAVPKTLDDLMNPALKGKLALAGTTTGQRWLGSVLHAMGQQKGEQWLRQFAAAQKPTVQQISGLALLDLIAKGEVAASPTIYRDHVAGAAAKGAPVKWVALPPVTGNTGQVAMAAKAPHPHVALLFIDFLLGQDGANVYHEDHYATAIDKFDFEIWIPERDRTLKQIEADNKLWSSLFKDIFR